MEVHLPGRSAGLIAGKCRGGLAFQIQVHVIADVHTDAEAMEAEIRNALSARGRAPGGRALAAYEAAHAAAPLA